MFRFLVAVCAVALGAGGACAEVADHPPAFTGRSGATKIKIILVCGIPNAPPPAPEVAPPREVGAKSLDAKKLRELAEQWSGDLPKRSGKELAELLDQVPPKYRQMVKDYFEQLEKARDKK